MKDLGINPSSKGHNIGSGMACGLCVTCDLPYAIVATFWNLVYKKFPLRSLGVVSFRDIIAYKDKNVGFYFGVLLFGLGIPGWFHFNPCLYALSAIALIVGIVATIKVNTGKK